MSSTHTLIILVNSLTKTEKRYFHLYSNLQSGDKVYISLFNLIDSNTSPEDLYSCFCKFRMEGTLKPQLNTFIAQF